MAVKSQASDQLYICTAHYKQYTNQMYCCAHRDDSGSQEQTVVLREDSEIKLLQDGTVGTAGGRRKAG